VSQRAPSYPIGTWHLIRTFSCNPLVYIPYQQLITLLLIVPRHALRAPLAADRCCMVAQGISTAGQGNHQPAVRSGGVCPCVAAPLAPIAASELSR
jgi:hypothetical protein